MNIRNLLPPEMQTAGFLLKWGAIAAVVIFVVVLGWWFLTEPGRANKRAAEAHAGQAVAQGETAITADSAKAADDLAGRQRARDEQLGDSNANILAQPGASLPVDSGVNDAVLRAQCVRDDYRGDRACIRLRQQDSAKHP